MGEGIRYAARCRGVTWSVYEVDLTKYPGNNPILHNLLEWQARAIAAILNNKE